MAPLLTKNFALLKKEIIKHVEEDKVAQGRYWTGESGCFIGCLSHGDDTLAIEQTYGLPVMVQRIAESIFEGLSAKESVAFFAALPEVTACDGKDLSRVGWQFMAAELRSLPTQSDDIQAVIAPIIAGLDLLANDTKWAASAAKAAWAAARAASAASAARAAAEAAASAARAAWAAASAASAAARAASAASAAAEAASAAARAASAASAAAEAASAARRRQRDLLLQLIKDAPVVK